LEYNRVMIIRLLGLELPFGKLRQHAKWRIVVGERTRHNMYHYHEWQVIMTRWHDEGHDPPFPMYVYIYITVITPL
jgi:hypothetical protein